MIHFAGAEEGSPREKDCDRIVFVHSGVGGGAVGRDCVNPSSDLAF